MAIANIPALELAPETHVNPWNGLRRWWIDRQLVADARKEYREAKRIYRHCPCQATLDDLIVARECYERIR